MHHVGCQLARFTGRGFHPVGIFDHQIIHTRFKLEFCQVFFQVEQFAAHVDRPGYFFHVFHFQYRAAEAQLLIFRDA